MRKRKTMQPDELPAAIPAEPVNDTRLTDALMALATAHANVQDILTRFLGSPQNHREQVVVQCLGSIRAELWQALTNLGTGHPLYGTTMGREQ